PAGPADLLELRRGLDPHELPARFRDHDLHHHRRSGGRDHHLRAGRLRDRAQLGPPAVPLVVLLPAGGDVHPVPGGGAAADPADRHAGAGQSAGRRDPAHRLRAGVQHAGVHRVPAHDPARARGVDADGWRGHLEGVLAADPAATGADVRHGGDLRVHSVLERLHDALADHLGSDPADGPGAAEHVPDPVQQQLQRGLLLVPDGHGARDRRLPVRAALGDVRPHPGCDQVTRRPPAEATAPPGSSIARPIDRPTPPPTDPGGSSTVTTALETAPTALQADPDWWRQAAVYQIYPRSFADGNGDGIGDLRGIISRVPYLKSLGIDAVWLSPFYPSALADGGYDVDDYRDVDPKIGTLEQFDEMVAALHGAGIRLIVDVVPNHSSDRHEWFQEALASPKGSNARERYIFRDGRGENGELPPADWSSIFSGPAWTRVPDGQW